MRNLYFLLFASLVIACNSNPSPEKSENQQTEQSVDQKTGNSSEIENTKWYLVDIGEIPYQASEGDSAYFTLNSADSRITGRLGCNTFFGTYELKEKQKISFSKLGVTMMACPDMSTEKEMHLLFREADNYIIEDGILYLRVSKGKRLAVFKSLQKD